MEHTSRCLWMSHGSITLVSISGFRHCSSTLLPSYQKLSTFIPPSLSAMTFLPWSQSTMDWIPWNQEPNETSPPLNWRGCVLHHSGSSLFHRPHPKVPSFSLGLNLRHSSPWTNFSGVFWLLPQAPESYSKLQVKIIPTHSSQSRENNLQILEALFSLVRNSPKVGQFYRVLLKLIISRLLPTTNSQPNY